MPKVVAQKQICDTKNPVRLHYQQKSENHVARNRIYPRNGLRYGILRKRQSKLWETVIFMSLTF